MTDDLTDAKLELDLAGMRRAVQNAARYDSSVTLAAWELCALLDELDRAHAAHAEQLEEEAKLRARLAELEAALRHLDHWAEVYLTPRRGMGADLPRHDLPMLAPSAAKALRQCVARALAEEERHGK